MVKLRHEIIPADQNHDSGLIVNCQRTSTLVDYEQAVAQMEDCVTQIAKNEAKEQIWLLEHPSIYTAGTSSNEQDLLTPKRFPVHKTGRGGQYTYHGPGQRIAYVMLNLNQRKPDVRQFVAQLEEVLIRTLRAFDVVGERREDRVGVWVRRPEKGNGVEDKIAAMGIRVRKWVTFHGLSLNVNPDIEHFSGIVPCGVQEHGTTSLHDLGKKVSMNDVDAVLMQQFENVFGMKVELTQSF